MPAVIWSSVLFERPTRNCCVSYTADTSQIITTSGSWSGWGGDLQARKTDIFWGGSWASRSEKEPSEKLRFVGSREYLGFPSHRITCLYSSNGPVYTGCWFLEARFPRLWVWGFSFLLRLFELLLFLKRCVLRSLKFNHELCYLLIARRFCLLCHSPVQSK